MKNRFGKGTWVLLFSLISCTGGPKEIQYGSDMCHYCKMIIVDQQHAAELVSSKGKIFKFDAIECMINYLSDNHSTEFKYQLVNTYQAPGILINALDCSYLISDAIPSPMGEYLTAFRDIHSASEMQKQKGGKMYDWPSLQQHLGSNKIE